MLDNLPSFTERPLEYGPETPVSIFQHRFEFEQLLRLYQERSPYRVLEVGSYYGGTLYHWLREASRGTEVVSVDTYTAADNRNRYGDWVLEGTQLAVIEGDSLDESTIERVKKHAPFDWIFIDADHYYGSVRADWDNYSPMAEDGAVIAFHDILTNPAHPEIEVERLWRELQQQGYITQEIIADPEANWGGIGVIYL